MGKSGLSQKPTSITEVMDENKVKLHANRIERVKKPNILIAGCGTGQHSIDTASRFKNCKVLAG